MRNKRKSQPDTPFEENKDKAIIDIIDTTTAPTEWTEKDDEIIKQYRQDVKDGKVSVKELTIKESISKVVEPKKRVRSINKIKFWCVTCTSSYTIHLKADDGTFQKPQGICPHMTLQDYEMLY